MLFLTSGFLFASFNGTKLFNVLSLLKPSMYIYPSHIIPPPPPPVNKIDSENGINITTYYMYVVQN